MRGIRRKVDFLASSWLLWKVGSRPTLVGPIEDSPLLVGSDRGVVFEMQIPNPDYDSEDTIVVRGNPIYGRGGGPTKTVAWMLVLYYMGSNRRVYVGQVATNPEYRRQGLMSELHDAAWKWAKSRGLEFDAGWVQSRYVDRYWRQLERAGKAVGYDDKHNVGGRGWKRVD